MRASSGSRTRKPARPQWTSCAPRCSAGSPLARREPDDPAVVLFTSGSEGAPKGVALSHANLLANIAQIGTRFDLRLTDICFNPLPLFHAFGLTGGLLLGLVSSMKVYLYPTPLHYREIPKTIDKAQATFLLGADTFLAHYARSADESAFKSLRYIIAGAEAVKAETRRLYKEKFGLAVLEGYGVTEASPVIAVNAPAFSKGWNRGQAPAVRRAAPRAGARHRGRRRGSSYSGPNIMLGYYRPENPGVIEAPPGRLVRHGRHRRDRRGGLCRHQGARQALRQDRRRDGVARFGRGSRRWALARPCRGRDRGARPQARRARDPGDHQAGRDAGGGAGLDEDQGRIRVHAPLVGRRPRRRSRCSAPARPIMWLLRKRSATAERNRGSRVSPRANGRLVSTAPPCEVCSRR